MSVAKALVCHPSDGQNHFALEDVPIPALQPQEVLVRISATAQNPTDIKGFDQNRFGDGAVLGCDFCGQVESVGGEVTEVKNGDRVAGLVQGGRPGCLGAYATHTIVKQAFCFKVPDTISSAAAATVPLALTTAWLALLSPYCLGIDRTAADQIQLLIWGGSTSVGQYTIQIARHFGFQFATTCRNKESVEALGATHVYDYRSPTVIEDIKKALPAITYVLDCVGNETSSAQASSAVCDGGGVLCTIQPMKTNTQNVEKNVKVTDVVVFTAFFDDLVLGPFKIPKREDDRDLATELYGHLPDMLSSGIIKPNPVRVVEGGLKGVINGFQLYRDNAISGQKLVYNIA
ncbi:GroES-like protein [Mytilinidion resinicola]|uniref:GroES-like protein n=1 Tax=Mytilinidion resinicola TaxID=574789 RepID=A0A6A6YVJ7_9PEZI|nr:GroES-like protein [Mytilinidion resinicola]KAF2812014.1 GroES-like protein [Mytilinidion resinicola]